MERFERVVCAIMLGSVVVVVLLLVGGLLEDTRGVRWMRNRRLVVSSCHFNFLYLKMKGRGMGIDIYFFRLWTELNKLL